MRQIFDAHLDMAWNAIEFHRDLLQPASEIRKRDREDFADLVPGDCTVSWVELRRGGISTIIATLLPCIHRRKKTFFYYDSPEAAYGASHGQLAYYRALIERGELRHIADKRTLEAHIAQWDSEAENRPPIGFILSMEGSWSILGPENIAQWYENGLRILGPAHYGPDRYCHGTGSEGGLKQDGPALLREMERAGMLLDVTHLADKSFWEALDIYSGPVLASHHNCRALVPGDRQLTDEQIKALIERDAVIGAVFDCWMLKPGWKKGVSDPATVSLEDVANHIDHICQLAGSARHCGLGTDLDGGFGKEQTPHDIDTIADLGNLAATLEKRGYSEADIDGIFFHHFVDFFRRAWP